MDNPGESVPTGKEHALANGGRKRPLECRREFQLQRQYPSTVKQALQSGINIVEPFTWNLMQAGDARVPSDVRNGVPCNLQKLRILSPNGRDLGEFNVELKPTDSSKQNAITIIKSNFKPDKPSASPLSPPVLPTKVLPRILKQCKKNNVAISCSGKTLLSDNSVSHERRPTILSVNKVPSSDQEDKMEKQTYNGNSINLDNTLSMNGINFSACQIVDSSNQKYTVHGTDFRNCTKVQGTAAENDEVSLATETLRCEESIEPLYPANCERLTNSGGQSNIPLPGKSLNVSKGKCIVTIKNTEKGKVVMSLKSAANFMQRYNQIEKNFDQNNLCNDSRKNFSSSEVSYDKNNMLQTKSDIVPKSQVPEIKTHNVMTIIPNKTLSFNQNVVLEPKNNTPIASTSIKNIVNVTDHNTKYDNTQSKDSKVEFQNDDLVVIDDHVRHNPKSQQITDVANVQSDEQNKKLPQNDLSNQLNIIKKAMDSVKDSELRELALKALADCGIGIERYVPIRPPEDHKAVHDTQVQTLVFGLLDPKSFILINKDLEHIHRLNQITLHNMPEENLLSNNLHSNNSKDPNVNQRAESPFDLDSFMEQFWKEDSDTLKMKETLSTTRVRCNSLMEHLQRDFEHVKRYDRKGMLNIHNAVMSDNVYLVQRQLMVLKHCKQSVDILTENGRVILFSLSNLSFNFISF